MKIRQTPFPLLITALCVVAAVAPTHTALTVKSWTLELVLNYEDGQQEAVALTGVGPHGRFYRDDILKFLYAARFLCDARRQLYGERTEREHLLLAVLQRHVQNKMTFETSPP